MHRTLLCAHAVSSNPGQKQPGRAASAQPPFAHHTALALLRSPGISLDRSGGGEPFGCSLACCWLSTSQASTSLLATSDVGTSPPAQVQKARHKQVCRLCVHTCVVKVVHGAGHNAGHSCAAWKVQGRVGHDRSHSRAPLSTPDMWTSMPTTFWVSSPLRGMSQYTLRLSCLQKQQRGPSRLCKLGLALE